MAGKKRVPARLRAKQEWKPQGFTKKEWITIGIVIGAIALAVLGYFLLRDFFDGSLRVSDGKVQADANWIVANTGDSSKPKYFKLGTVSEVDGYTLTVDSISDQNVPNFVYEPVTAGAIDNATILPAKGKAQDLAPKVAANYGSYLQNAVSSEVTQMTVGGRAGWSFYSDFESPVEEAAATPAPEATVAPEATPAATPAPAVKINRVVNIYFDASRDMSVLTSISASADTKEQLPSVEDMYKAIDPIIKGLTIDGEAQATAAPATEATAEPTAAASPAA